MASDINAHTQNRGTYFEITLNSKQLNRPDLLIARTVLHELFHAEIYAALKLKSGNNDQIPEDMNGFAERFNKYVPIYYGKKDTFIPENDIQHRYMAENLLGIMGRALMDVHQKQFPEDYTKLNDYVKRNGDYLNGLTVEFYKNLFWEGLYGTHAFAQMQSIKTKPPIKSPSEKLDIDIGISELMTKPCGN